jgi:hypothetical protein
VHGRAETTSQPMDLLRMGGDARIRSQEVVWGRGGGTVGPEERAVRQSTLKCKRVQILLNSSESCGLFKRRAPQFERRYGWQCGRSSAA